MISNFSRILFPILFIFQILFYPEGHSQSFNEVSRAIGVNHLTISFNLIGGGLAFFDYDNDGHEDLIVIGGAAQDRLFRNNGDGTFTDETIKAGLNNSNYFKTQAVVTGDINNDGFREIFIATDIGNPNILYLNNGDGTFTNISEGAGIIHESWSLGATLLDFNQDGMLDIYVINYIEENNALEDGFAHTCFPNFLYLNKGNNQFEEVASTYLVDEEGCGVAVTSFDENKDGKTDIYIANDFGEFIVPNVYFQNNFPNSFEDKSVSSGLDAHIYGMGIGLGDIDNDGHTDLYTTNIGRNVLYHNNGNGTYTDLTTSAGVENTNYEDLFTTSWGAVFFDYDLDGAEDLFVSNGFIPASDFIKTSEVDPNKLYRNNGDLTFEDVTIEENIFNDEISRGAAYSDFDHDGDLDLAVVKLGKVLGSPGNMLFYQNKSSTGNHWLQVKLEGTTSNRDAYGSTVYAYHGNTIWSQEISGGSSHASQNSSIAHFGLGNTETIDSLVVRWPNGETVTLINIEADHTYYIVENTAGYEILGCTDSNSINYDPEATLNQGCIFSIFGCTDPRAENYNPTATEDNNTCEFSFEVEGCMDDTALNFDKYASVDDGSCSYVLNAKIENSKTKVYPTRWSNSFIIESNEPQLEVKMYSFEGKLVHHHKYTNGPKFKISPEINPGSYILVFSNGIDIERIKVIKE